MVSLTTCLLWAHWPSWLPKDKKSIYTVRCSRENKTARLNGRALSPDCPWVKSHRLENYPGMITVQGKEASNRMSLSSWEVADRKLKISGWDWRVQRNLKTVGWRNARAKCNKAQPVQEWLRGWQQATVGWFYNLAVQWCKRVVALQQVIG